VSLTGSLTHSGVEMTRDSGVPSLEDIALALSRQPRFGGHTREFWSVCEHSLFVELLATADGILGALANSVERRQLRLAALLHDAHEAITSDISTHFKTAGMRMIQDQLDIRIMEAYLPGGIAAYRALAPRIKVLDHRALLAEAYELHPAIHKGNIGYYFGETPQASDVVMLRGFRALVSDPRQRFITQYTALRNSW
jgi:hypothetical protein